MADAHPPHRGGGAQGDAGQPLRHPGLPGHQPGVRHRGGFPPSGGRHPRPGHEVHHRRRLQPHIAGLGAGADPPGVVFPGRAGSAQPPCGGLVGCSRPGLYPQGTVALPDRYAENVGGDRGRLPLRCGQQRAPGLLGPGAAGGGSGPPRLHLAGGERPRRPCAGSAAAGCLLRHGYGAVPGLRHDLRLRHLAVV